jgi:hypothetical protein
MVEDWTTERTNPRYSVFQHYAVAYSIISDIGKAFRNEGEPFDGYTFFANIFHEMVQKGLRLDSTLQIVSLMEAASTNGSRIASMFMSWNFNVLDIYQIYSRIESLREKLRDPSPILSLFAPSMLAKLVEAENSLESENFMLAQELVREVEAFMDRIWVLIGTLLLIGATSIYLALPRKTRREVAGQGS